MRAGQLNKMVRVEQKTAVANTYGEPVPTWTLFAERSAGIRPLVGRERWAAQQVNAQVTHEIRMRYFDGLRADMRITHGGRVFTILAPLNTDERGREYVIPCEEEVQ